MNVGRTMNGNSGAGDAPHKGPHSECAGRRRAIPRIHLASTSPRRRELLAAAGVTHDAAPPGVDDGELRPGRVSPEQWVAALAYLKAAASMRKANAPGDGEIFLGADTVVVRDGEIHGQPTDEAHARQMLRMMRNRSHEVVTGVALVSSGGHRRQLFIDRAQVFVGDISDAEIDAYIASGQWRGKAGAYNLAERIAAGWPIRCEGDPGTVMGLPVRTLLGRLEAFARTA